MRKVLLLGVGMCLMAPSPPANAATQGTALFVCEGELVKSAGGYEIDQKGVAKEDNPMVCYINNKTLRQILSVCHLGDLCVVSAQGESGNGNRHLIQRVLEVHLSLRGGKLK